MTQSNQRKIKQKPKRLDRERERERERVGMIKGEKLIKILLFMMERECKNILI